MYNGEQYLPSKERLLLLQAAILFLFTLILFRLWFFQIYKGQENQLKARNNITRQEPIYAPRGVIRDRNGVLLADNNPSYGLALIREQCRDLPGLLSQVSQWTGRKRSSLQETFARGKEHVKPFNPQLLVPNLDFQELARIETHIMDWPELQIVARPLRGYPKGRVMSHILGFVAQADKQELRNNPDLDLGDMIGKQGVEQAFESRLRGQKGRLRKVVNAQGKKLKETVMELPEPGRNLYLSIDFELQEYLGRLMADKTGAAVVMSPENGDILAMVSTPDYDNNLFVQGIEERAWERLRSDPDHPMQNRVISSAYPPGSVFKLLVAAAALGKGGISPEKEIYCPGRYRLGRGLFRCWKKWGHGHLDLHEAIKQSCDVYFYNLGHELGVDLISSYARDNGFGRKTGLDLPGESKGLVPDREWKLRRFGEKWQGGETVILAIGQGYMLTTPLQTARFIGALANGGDLLKPKLSLYEQVQKHDSLQLSDKDRRFILRAMVAAVEEPHGTASILRTPGAVVGGKTGTAQVVRMTDETRGKEVEEMEYKFRDHAWMGSFAQKNGKKYVVVVLVEHGGHGSSGAGPIVKSIYDFLF
ncbi:MAG: penicillin-binding protein 2 [Desulfohalobiaceae bacterium]|nr:penicillin-binding protein 2 [Desulfohalobiaceae bacterium]